MRRKQLNKLKKRRKIRNRTKIVGTVERPRFSIFRSNTSLYVQFIDDVFGKTLVSASSREATGKEKNKASKLEQAKLLGKIVAEKAMKAGVKSAVVDRGQYKYHGRVKAVVEAARENGIKI